MEELGLEANAVRTWYAIEARENCSLVRIGPEAVGHWSNVLGVPIRRCYVSDTRLQELASRPGVTQADVVAAVLPDPGSTMSGDFGEILEFVLVAASDPDVHPIGIKKWRLKQDRTKPAPRSDVVELVLPAWPAASEDDMILCSEVKAKATNQASKPISSAIQDCQKDRASRLTKTMVWLKERVIDGTAVDVELAQLNRFIEADTNPPSTRRFRAVAVITADLVDAEMAADPPGETDGGYDVVIVSVPELKQAYERAYQSAHASVTG